MRVKSNYLATLVAAVLCTATGFAQTRTETSVVQQEDAKLMDGVYERTLAATRPTLGYDNVREGDVFWEKRIWRVIDTREKINKPFSNPKEPFIKILMDAAKDKQLKLYSTVDGDQFKTRLKDADIKAMITQIDTVMLFESAYPDSLVVVENNLNWEDIKRFRVKEVWFFDSETSTLSVRIIGIAPIQEVYDDQGNFKYEKPMFWAYYPELRKVLARHEAFNPANDAKRMSWEDVMEMRLFSSYIFKESNVYDRRIQDYKAGIDILFEAENIKHSVFNFEHDLWQY
jgi:gliding motility associated protien GldN